MFEILMYLFESYFDVGDYPEFEKLSKKLSAAGFEGEDISEALSWLAALQKQDAVSYPAELSHKGFRHFAEFEKQFISDEARQFLLFAEQQALITVSEREMIIDRAIALKQRDLSEDKLRLIMLMVLWNQHKAMEPLLVEELLVPIDVSQLH